MPIWQDTASLLREKAQVHESCLVAYSGGKDSLCVLDLCCRAFKRVVAFYMYFVPGLKVIEDQLRFATERWGVPVVQYPHWAFLRALKYGAFCDQHYAKDDLPDVKLLDIYNWARSEWKIDLIAHGAKSSDSIWRRRYFDCTEDWDWMLYPVKDWTKFDVLAYLKTHSIPVPQQDGTHRGGAVSGVDLALPAVLWLHDHHPEDWEKFLRWFPYADAMVARRDMYGIGVEEKGKDRARRPVGVSVV